MAKRSTLNLNRIRLQDQRRILKFERKYSRLVYGAIEKSVEPVLSNPDADINPKPIEDVYIRLYEEVGVEFATVNFRFMDSLKMKAEPGFFLTTWRKWMKDFALSRLANKVVEINDTTRKKIKEAIADALDRGIASRTEVAKLISEKTLGDIGKRRAKTIARTETAAAANEGKEKSADDWAKDAETDLYKIWIAGGSKEPRQSHLALDNGKAIPKDSQWNVDGEMMDRPHDPGASAANVINCNCTVVFVSERYAKRMNGAEFIEPKPVPAIENENVPPSLTSYLEKRGLDLDKDFLSLMDDEMRFRIGKNSYFQPGTNTITLVDYKDIYEAKKTLYHEIGHAIDNKNKFYSNPLTARIMNKYIDKYSANRFSGFENIQKAVRADYSQALSVAEQADRSGLMDTIMSLNDNYGYGHSKAYFRQKGQNQRQREFLAHAFENKFQGNEVFKKIAPDLYEDMIKLVDDLIKGIK